MDSYAAFNLVTLLKDVAQDGTAILCTIHQPASEVFHKFDLVVILVGGRVLYNGAVTKMSEYFSAFNYEIPDHHNPADFVMMLAQVQTVESLEAKKMFHAAPDDVSSKEEKQTQQLKDAGGKSVMTFSEDVQLDVKASLFRQLYYLTVREVQATYRNKVALIARFAITIILNLIFGLIFLDAGNRDDADSSNFTSHYGSLTMATISTMFGSAQPMLLEFPFHRPMFMREYSTGTYGAGAYFMAKTLVEAPLVYVQTVVQYAIVYNMCGWNGDFGLMTLVAWGLGIASSSLGVLMGSVVADVKTAAEGAPLLFVPQILFAGFFINIKLIPIFLRWAQYLCSLKYAMNLLLLLEFRPSSSACDDGAHQNCVEVLQRNQIYSDKWWVYVIILFALFVGFRVIAAIALAKKAKKFY